MEVSFSVIRVPVMFVCLFFFFFQKNGCLKFGVCIDEFVDFPIS